LVFVVIGVILFILPTVASSASETATGYVLTLLYLMTPLQLTMNSLPNLGRAGIALQRVEDMGVQIEANATEGTLAPAPEPKPVWQCLDLVDVTHTYAREGEESNFVLGPVSLSLHPREVVFLAGGNGSGKTTLAKLLTGLYVPESGEVRLDGRVVADVDREQFRQMFSAIFSDFYLFESLLGFEAAELDERARIYLQQLHLAHKVKVESGVLSTTDLSQGQRKRLALLTAYLEDRPIYVFDEWAADQDPHFRDIFYLELLPRLKAEGKAVLVISHDDRYYSQGDRLLKLEYGRLVAPAAVLARPAPAVPGFGEIA